MLKLSRVTYFEKEKIELYLINGKIASFDFFKAS
jgi:hypothetical protein